MIKLALNEWMLEDIAKRNREYVKLAMKEWDEKGEGDFASFVQRYIIYLWINMAGMN